MRTCIIFLNSFVQSKSQAAHDTGMIQKAFRKVT